MRLRKPVPAADLSESEMHRRSLGSIIFAITAREIRAKRIMDTTDKKFHINFWYVIAAVLGMLLIQDLYLESTKLMPIPYSRFQELLNENKIASVAIAQNYISGSLKEAQPDGLKDFITT